MNSAITLHLMKTILFTLCLGGCAATSTPLSAQLVDPLASTLDFTPSFSMTETISDKLVRMVEDGGDGEPDIVSYVELTTETLKVSLVANITGINLAEIGPDTEFSITVGNMTATGTLGDDPTYTDANKATKRSVFIPTLFDDNNKPKGASGFKLSWTATRLTASITRASGDSNDPGIAMADGYVGQNASLAPGAKPTAVRDIAPVFVKFGTLESEARIAFVQGSSSTYVKTVGNEEDGEESFDLDSVSVTAAFDTTAPTVAFTLPKTGSSLGEGATSFTFEGAASDEKDLEKVEYTSDLASLEWTEITEITDVSPTPANTAPLQYGTEKHRWTFSLSELPLGTSSVWVRARDSSGNLSKPAQITLINPIPILLTGRWDGLVDPTSDGVRGCITFTCDAKGAVSGKLTLEGTAAALPFTGAWSGETMQATLKRTGKPSLLLSAVMDTPEPNTVGDATLNCELVETAGTGTPERLLAAVNAFRSPFSKTSKVPAAAIGRFHVGIAKPANPAGHGYFSIVTTDAGVTTISGKLADGTGLTYSGVLGALGQVPIYISLYANKGSFTTLQWLDLMTGDVADADSFWNRPAAVADKQFPVGFSHTLTTSGQKYLIPGKDIRIMNLSAASAQAQWSGDNVPVEATQNLDVTPANKITAIGGTAAFKATVTPATGILTGTFSVSSSTGTAAWSALIIGSEAYGHYIVPAPKGSTAKPHGGISLE